MSREDAWPEWVSELIGADGYVLVKDGRERPRTKLIRNITRRVCRFHCNSGWMSRLETATIPILSPLIMGEGKVLSPDDCRVIARWAVKTHMAQELTGHGTMVLTPQSQREWMAEEHPKPPVGVHVWIAPFDHPTPIGHYDLIPLTLPGTSDGQQVDLAAPGAYERIGGYHAIIVVWHVVIVVACLYGYERRQLRHSIFPPIVRIWPPTGIAVGWPTSPAKFAYQTLGILQATPFTLA